MEWLAFAGSKLKLGAASVGTGELIEVSHREVARVRAS
jgi:hypothetical protein